jgi:hypothetical protein
VGCLLDKTAYLFVDLPATKAIFRGIQADLSCTPQISFAEKNIIYFLLKSSSISDVDVLLTSVRSAC